MLTIRHIRAAAFGLALLGSGAALAQETLPAFDPLQAREQARSLSSVERSAWREQQQGHVRNMTPDEQALMRETAADGRALMENRNGRGGDGAQKRRRNGSGQGGGYGQGYQSRQGQGGR